MIERGTVERGLGPRDNVKRRIRDLIIGVWGRGAWCRIPIEPATTEERFS